MKKNPLLNIIERELKKITIVNPQESKCRRIKLKKNQWKKSSKKQSTSKTEWGCQNSWVVSCEWDNPIESKIGKKTV